MNKENMTQTVEEATKEIHDLLRFGGLPNKGNFDFIAEIIQQQRQAAVEELMPVVRAAVELEKLTLVIESAVRWQDSAENHAGVLVALKANRSALAALPESIINKAKGE